MDTDAQHVHVRVPDSLTVRATIPALGCEEVLPCLVLPLHSNVMRDRGESEDVDQSRATGAPALVAVDLLPCDSSHLRRETKRGRPLSWSPSLVTEEDETMLVSLVGAYGPDEASATSFRERYLAFCTINSYDPTERKSLLACVAQARRQGMAASSIDTYVDRYLSEHPMKGAWYIRSLTTAAHANSAPVNPRPTEWDEEALLNIVRSAVSVGDELLLWTLLVTGARPADVERLTFQQVSIEEDCVRISWWLRKAQRTRRERHEETYSFRWAFPPSERVRDFFKGRPGTHGILPLEKCYQRGRIAAHVSALLEPLGLTSYVFRDRLEALLVGEGASSGTMKDLLDHCDGTGRSSYRKTPLAKATADRVRAAKVSKKKK